MANSSETIIAGTLQFDVKTGDPDANLASAVDGIHRLGEKRAQVTVLPELWSCGFDKPAMIRQQAENTPQIIDILGKLAIKYQMIIAGSLPETSDDCLYNTMVIIDKDGTVAGQYRKIHLFSFINEDRSFMAGNRALVCNTSCGPVGVMICFDLRFPELCRTLAIQGARMVLISAQWPQSRILHWDALLTARAIENQLFIVASNRVGKDGDLTFNGHSQIISPDGTILSRIIDQPTETTAQINFNEIDTLRNQFDCLKERIPAAYLL
jgi:omega-amidase